MTNFLRTLILCISALAVSSGVAAADFKKQIEARQAYMKVLGYNMGILGAMAGEKSPYDADLAATAAQNLALAASMSNGTMWPQGSDMNSSDKTKAKPELWQNFPDVAQLLDDLKMRSQTLAGSAGNGLGGLQQSIGDVGKTCKGCHDDFRAKKKE